MDLGAGSLAASLLISTVGLALFVYGKKEVRVPQLATGAALMVYPYFVTSPAWMLSLGGLLLGGLWLALRAGL